MEEVTSMSHPASRVLLCNLAGDDLDMYRLGLEADGFQVESVSPAPDSVPAPAHPTDIVVLDLQPIHDGITARLPWELVPLIRRWCRDVPVVLLTAYVRPDAATRSRARHETLAAFVAKPCPPGALASILRAVLRGERGIEALSSLLPPQS
jgi:CheY-like chemotaxis protein